MIFSMPTECTQRQCLLFKTKVQQFLADGQAREQVTIFREQFMVIQTRTLELVIDIYIEDGSYIKIKNINLSYTLPKDVFGQNFNSVKIFVSAQNLVTWTKYSGFDPEVPVNGIDNGTYPITRTVSLGLNIGF